MQEHHLTRELELMLERMESPAWSLAPQADQPHAIHSVAARVPAAYQSKVNIPKLAVTHICCTYSKEGSYCLQTQFWSDLLVTRLDDQTRDWSIKQETGL